MTTAAIGQKLKEAVDHFREEAADNLEQAAAIEEAWKEWDEDRLFSYGVISKQDAETIRQEKENAK